MIEKGEGVMEKGEGEREGVMEKGEEGRGKG